MEWLTPSFQEFAEANSSPDVQNCAAIPKIESPRRTTYAVGSTSAEVEEAPAGPAVNLVVV
jgi:hypothetical protein